MGMYTEFIFGCKLSKDTPKECLDSLDYVINGEEGHSYIRWNSNTNKIEVDKYERTTSQKDIDAFIEKMGFVESVQMLFVFFRISKSYRKILFRWKL